MNLGLGDRQACEALVKKCKLSGNLAPVIVAIGSEPWATGGIHVIDDIAWLTGVAVDKSYRRQGLGSAIVKSLISLAHFAGTEEIWLETIVWNVKFYVPLGFEHVPVAEVPQIVKSLRTNTNCCFMRRKLRS